MQRRHRINRTEAPALADMPECSQIRSAGTGGYRHKFKVVQTGQSFEAGIGQRVNSHYIAGFQQPHHGNAKTVLSAIND